MAFPGLTRKGGANRPDGSDVRSSRARSRHCDRVQRHDPGAARFSNDTPASRVKPTVRPLARIEKRWKQRHRQQESERVDNVEAGICPVQRAGANDQLLCPHRAVLFAMVRAKLSSTIARSAPQSDGTTARHRTIREPQFTNCTAASGLLKVSAPNLDCQEHLRIPTQPQASSGAADAPDPTSDERDRLHAAASSSD